MEETDMDLGCSDVAVWRHQLSEYGKRIKEMGDGNPKLVELDNFYRFELPSAIETRKPSPYITRQELMDVMQWKLRRGNWRPRLMSFVSGLNEEEVKEASRKAFEAVPDCKGAVAALSSLKGVGPATASAVLAAFAPHLAPFMSDEAMEAAFGNSKDYSLKRYLLFAQRLQDKAKELNEMAASSRRDDESLITACDVERALWSSAMGSKSKESMKVEVNRKKKRKKM